MQERATEQGRRRTGKPKPRPQGPPTAHSSTFMPISMRWYSARASLLGPAGVSPPGGLGGKTVAGNLSTVCASASRHTEAGSVLSKPCPPYI